VAFGSPEGQKSSGQSNNETGTAENLVTWRPLFKH